MLSNATAVLHVRTQGNQVSGSVREAARQAILHEASIVFSTLSFAGSGVLHRTGRGFDVVVIDEAAQVIAAVHSAYWTWLLELCKVHIGHASKLMCFMRVDCVLGS